MPPCLCEQGAEPSHVRGCLGKDAPEPVAAIENAFDQRNPFPCYQCPRKLAREDRETMRALGLWRVFKDTGAGPGPGGFLDQPAAFVDLVTLANTVEAHSIEMDRAKAAAQARVNQAKR